MKITNYGWSTRVLDPGDLQPGDLVFGAKNLSDPSTIYHVGMYIGAGT